MSRAAVRPPVSQGEFPEAHSAGSLWVETLMGSACGSSTLLGLGQVDSGGCMGSAYSPQPPVLLVWRRSLQGGQRDPRGSCTIQLG